MHTKNVIKPEYKETIDILEKYIEIITERIISKFEKNHSLMKIREPYKFDAMLHKSIYYETLPFVKELANIYTVGSYITITFEEGEENCLKEFMKTMNS